MKPPAITSDIPRQTKDVDSSDIDEDALLGSSQETIVQENNGGVTQTSTPNQPTQPLKQPLQTPKGRVDQERTTSCSKQRPAEPALF